MCCKVGFSAQLIGETVSYTPACNTGIQTTGNLDLSDMLAQEEEEENEKEEEEEEEGQDLEQ